MNYTRATNINECKLIKVIQVKSIVGDGTVENPIVEIIEYYSLDGERLARTIPTETQLDEFKD